MTPTIEDGPVSVYLGDVRQVLAELPSESVQCVVTSPPYWGLRDYQIEGQLGLEPTPTEYLDNMVAVFAEVKRVLRSDGTLWLNIGDSYAASRSGPVGEHSTLDGGGPNHGNLYRNAQAASRNLERSHTRERFPELGVKPKDLMGIPWMLAFALRADGWYLRSDIIWSKPNPMPESVRDRPTKAHEYLFLLAKSDRYYYDAEAIREPAEWARWGDQTVKKEQQGTAKWIGNRSTEELRRKSKMPDGWDTGPGAHGSFHRQGREKGKNAETAKVAVKGGDRHSALNDNWDAAEAAGAIQGGRNKRSVWEIPTQPYPEAHFATYPEKLVEPCLLAGTREGDLVLDPFAGSGTTLAVARRLGRRAIGIELQPNYLDLVRKRIAAAELPLLEAIAAAPLVDLMEEAS